MWKQQDSYYMNRNYVSTTVLESFILADQRILCTDQYPGPWNSNWKKSTPLPTKTLANILQVPKDSSSFYQLKKKASVSQTDEHPTLLFNIQILYQSDAVAESFAH